MAKMNQKLTIAKSLFLLAALFFTGLSLSACSIFPSESRQPDYYLLLPIQSEKSAQLYNKKPAFPGGSKTILLGPVEIPAYLDRSEIVMRDGNNSLVISSFHRWAEPLDRAIERVLATNLTNLSNGRFTCYPFSMKMAVAGQKPDIGLTVNVLEFEKVGNTCRLNAEYFLTNTHNSKILHKKVALISRVQGSTVSHAVRCQNRLLNEFSYIILKEIKEWP